MPSDVSLTGSTLVVITGITTALCSTIGLLFQQLMKSKDQQIAYLQARIQVLEAQSEQGTELAEVATSALKRQGRGR